MGDEQKDIPAVLGTELISGLLRATEQAALAAFDQIGRGDEFNADKVAVEKMRAALNEMNMAGRIVIGEGERDKAPMLFIGEEVGSGKGQEVDIAVDPLEGTTLTANAQSNALAVAALAFRGGLLYAPDVYMEKIAIGAGYPKDVIALDAKPADNIKSLAQAKKQSASKITVCVLDRPRHQDIIESVRSTGAAIHLITDGDVAGVIHTTQKNSIDIYMGIGGAPEGVLAASALHCVGGQMQTRLVLDSKEKIERASKMGIEDPQKVYQIKDMVKGDVVFVATGVTGGSLLKACRKTDNSSHTHSLLMLAAQRETRFIEMVKR